MKLRQKKKNYKKKYGVNPIKDINGKYMLNLPPHIAEIKRLGESLNRGIDDAIKIFDISPLTYSNVLPFSSTVRNYINKTLAYNGLRYISSDSFVEKVENEYSAHRNCYALETEIEIVNTIIELVLHGYDEEEIFSVIDYKYRL